MRRPILVSVLLLLATIVYVELRLPVPLDAQGRAAVYERVSVVDTALDAIRVAGGIVVATLRVTGDAILPANSVQEVEIDIGNAPTDDYFLQWDATAGKPTWQEIGFRSWGIGHPFCVILSLTDICPDTVRWRGWKWSSG